MAGFWSKEMVLNRVSWVGLGVPVICWTVVQMLESHFVSPVGKQTHICLLLI